MLDHRDLTECDERRLDFFDGQGVQKGDSDAIRGESRSETATFSRRLVEDSATSEKLHRKKDTFEGRWAESFRAAWAESLLLPDPNLADKTYHLIYKTFILSFYRDGTYKLRARNQGTDLGFIERIKATARQTKPERGTNE